MNLERLRQRFFEGLTRYRWQETVGRGGMGIVFKAQDLDLDDVVAIKVLSPDWETDDQQLLQRFKREINLNRKIKHPNVARIHDFGTSNDFPYITMEYVPGKDLRTIIQIEGKLPQARAISILRQIALGTEAAHKLGIIHRDLKSQNVMVEDSGAVAILDFGLARGKTTEQLTLDSVMVGTPHYMSPEQALGRPTDARSDVYSIGVMAYEILTGNVPFDGESPLVIAMKHVSEPPPNDLRKATDVTPELIAITYKALAKEPSSRFASAADLEAELAMLRPFESGAVSVVSAPHPAIPAVTFPSAPGMPIETPASRGTHPELASMPTPAMPPSALHATSGAMPVEAKNRPPVVLLVECRQRRQRERLGAGLVQRLVEGRQVRRGQMLEFLADVAELRTKGDDVLELVGRRRTAPRGNRAVELVGVLAQPLLAGDRAPFGRRNDFLAYRIELAVERLESGDQRGARLTVLARIGDFLAQAGDAVEERRLIVEERIDFSRSLILCPALGLIPGHTRVETHGELGLINLVVLFHVHGVDAG